MKWIKWSVLNVEDNQEAGLGKVGVDLGINNEGDEV